jgi:TRAP-type C4-dicarboxylate transport system permease small subunit
LTAPIRERQTWSVLQRLSRFVFDTGPRAIISMLLVIAVAINFANVIGRYLFDHAIFWTEEILGFLLLWSVFIGMVAVTYNGAHLAMDLLLRRLSGWPQRLVRGAAALTMIACAAVVVVQSVKVISVLARTGQVSVAAGVPLVVPHASILVGFALAGLAVVVRFRAYLTDKFE